MKKKTLIGSMLVLTLLLLMPSIPAIQQKTIEDKAYSDFVEEIKKSNGDIKFRIQPILGLLWVICRIRESRGDWLMDSSSYWDHGIHIDYPIIYTRGEWLYVTSYLVMYILSVIFLIFGYPYVTQIID